MKEYGDLNLEDRRIGERICAQVNRGRLRWAGYGVVTALLSSTLLLSACQATPLVSARATLETIPAIVVSPKPMLSPEEETILKHTNTITTILQKILRPNIYKSISDERLALMAAISAGKKVSSQDCQLVHQTLDRGVTEISVGYVYTLPGVRFNFQEPPPQKVYGAKATFDILIDTAQSAYRVNFLPHSTDENPSPEFRPSLAFALFNRPDGYGEMGTGLVEGLDGNNYLVLIDRDQVINYTFWERGAKVPLGW